MTRAVFLAIGLSLAVVVHATAMEIVFENARFRAVLGDGGGGWGVALAVVAAVNAVIALFFYARVLKAAFMDPAPDLVPAGAPLARPLAVALAITVAVVLAAGFYPQMLAFFGEAARGLALP